MIRVLFLFLCFITCMDAFSQGSANYIIIDNANIKRSRVGSGLFARNNTMYSIRCNIDLNGDTLQLPSGCSLDFQGGTIVNGTLTGDLMNEYVRPEWFGAKGDGVTDDTKAIKMAVALGKQVVFTRHYCISEPIIIKDQGITVSKQSVIKAIGRNMDYVFKYRGSTKVVYLDGDGTIDCNGLCGGIYYDTPKTFRLQNLYINRPAKNPALYMKNGFLESYNISCDGRGVDKNKQPEYNVMLAGGSDHKMDRWTIVTSTTGVGGCAGSSIFTRVHVWGRSDCGFSVSGTCTFNMCYTDYCSKGFIFRAKETNSKANVTILNHNTIGKATDVLLYSCCNSINGVLSLAAHLNYKMKLLEFAPDIKNGRNGLKIDLGCVVPSKGGTKDIPDFRNSVNKDVLKGLQYYNTDTNQLMIWNGSAWDVFKGMKK